MRYAFIKYGNVIEELLEIGPMPKYVPDSGPKTFTSNYLKLVGNNPALFISCGSFDGNPKVTKENIEAQLYYQYSGVMRLVSVFILTAKILFKLLKFRADFTVCVQDGPALWATYITSIITKKPFIHSRQRAISSVGDSWRRRISMAVDNYVIRSAERVICHGPFTKHQLLNIGVIDERIIEYDVRLGAQVDQEKLYNQIDSININNNKVILFLGRVEESKGVFDLLIACEPILHRDEQVKLIYVGNGQALSRLKKYIEVKQLGAQVIAVGSVPHKEIFDYLHIATLMAMPTQHGLEGWGMSAVESLAMGVPVVAPNAGPFRFMIKDRENGLLYKVDDIEDLCKKIELVLFDSGLRSQLSDGAIKSEVRRDSNLITFGQALKLAHDGVCY